MMDTSLWKELKFREVFICTYDYNFFREKINGDFLREISGPNKEYGVDFILYTVQVERLTLWLYCSLEDF